MRNRSRPSRRSTAGDKLALEETAASSRPAESSQATTAVSTRSSEHGRKSVPHGGGASSSGDLSQAAEDADIRALQALRYVTRHVAPEHDDPRNRRHQPGTGDATCLLGVGKFEGDGRTLEHCYNDDDMPTRAFTLALCGGRYRFYDVRAVVRQDTVCGVCKNWANIRQTPGNITVKHLGKHWQLTDHQFLRLLDDSLDQKPVTPKRKKRRGSVAEVQGMTVRN